MITAAYSPLRSISNGSPASSIRLVSAYSSRLLATRERYSPIGTWNGSTWPFGMNHGLYSAWCSEDSVGYQPKRRYRSARTRSSSGTLPASTNASTSG